MQDIPSSEMHIPWLDIKMVRNNGHKVLILYLWSCQMKKSWGKHFQTAVISEQISIAGLSPRCVLILGWREPKHIDESGCNSSAKFFEGHAFSVQNFLFSKISWIHILFNFLLVRIHTFIHSIHTSLAAVSFNATFLHDWKNLLQFI